MNAHPPADSAACVLVVDDEPDLRTLYELTLLREGHQVHIAGSVAEAREQLAARQFDIVITDMRLPDGLGLELLRAVTAEQRRERCIVITAYGSAENAVEALKSGAFDYLTKPVDLKQFRAVVRSALQAPSSEQTTTAPAPLTPSVPTGSGSPRQSGTDALQKIIGDSPAMHAVRQRIVKIAQSMAPVLVHGESGTGKELVAQAIHACSHRGAGPFVPVNCGAIPESLLEAEFFGARKGSYTGAVNNREGFFQAARGGTLFLDEIGDLPLAMQAKLLRAIQERRIRPLGDTHEEAVDARIVSATHKDLAAEVQAGRFRQDLFYRLNVIEITVPPLRERREDLPALCQALLERIAADTGAPVYRLSARQWREIADAPLSGNVRELENLLHRAVALGEGGEADEPDTGAAMPAPAQPTPPAPPLSAVAVSPNPAPNIANADIDAVSALPTDLKAWLAEQERRILTRALEQTGFNRTAAAARLGLNLRQIRYRMAQLGISTPAADTDDDDADIG
jgi:two-component system response regulator PilR (NtrC family)